MASLSFGVSLGHEQGHEQKLERQAALSARTDCVLSADQVAVESFLQKLVACHALEQTVQVAVEAREIESEEDLDPGEFDLSDEDDCSVEPEFETTFSDGATPFLCGDPYEILVRSLDDGQVSLDVPPTGGEAYRALNPVGQAALDKLTERQKVYEAIAEWVRVNDAEGLARGPEAFLASHAPIAQVDFIDQAATDIDGSTLSKVLGEARLTWPEGSIPLRSLFK